MALNYFKSNNGQFHFFNDASYRATELAYDSALEGGKKVSVYKVPMHAGPWDRAGLIGHRKRGEILAEMGGQNTPEELSMLEYELKQLDRAYYDAGRDSLPPTMVAAA